ncbi:ATP-binding cassette domain-containing protein [Caldimonas sp. KR1-144]|uniref:ATP-binding cassette domain-containing protein n=1 Tax=Caldimonas sp. KR1-144 TaxID=3400911 RepID=UPI003C088511
MHPLQLEVSEFWAASSERAVLHEADDAWRGADRAAHPRPQLVQPPAPRGVALQLDGVGKRFGEREVLRGIDLAVAPGEFVAIVGRSGCGKSTLLRLLAGLDAASAGSIRLDGQPAAARKEATRVMFQDPRLLPWKRVLDNVALGLEGADARERSLDALAQVGLAERANDWPAVLSGGQRQRVALARALVHAPRLLLLDEPLGALDALTRIEMHRLIERLWRQHGFTALLVTHDVGEAVALADRVLLIEDGALAMDERIALERPRHRASSGAAALEERVLQRVLRQPAAEPAAPKPGWSWLWRVAI